MSRLTPDFTPAPEAMEILEGLKKKIGRVPNMFMMLAHAPNVLSGYMQMSVSLNQGTLTRQEIQQIALIAAGYDRCIYCASSHTLLARKAGIPDDEITNILNGQSNDSRTSALIKFCREMLDKRGQMSDDSFTEIRNAGYNDTQIVEIIASLALNIFSNYLNISVQTDLDYPKVDLD